MTIKSDHDECQAVEQYLQWHENGQPGQCPPEPIEAMQTQLKGQIVNVMPRQQVAMFRLVRSQARRLLRKSGFSDPVADIGPADYEPMPRRAIWSVAPRHDVYMTASGLQRSTDQSIFQSDDPKLLCAINMGMVWLIRDESILKWLTEMAYKYRTRPTPSQQ